MREELLEIIKRDQTVPSEWIFTDRKGNRRKKHAFMDKLRDLQRREFGLVKTKSNKNIRMTVCSELGKLSASLKPKDGLAIISCLQRRNIT